MKRITILGSTGSIGENTLRVVKSLPDRFRIVGLAVNDNYYRVLEQALEFGVQQVAVADPDATEKCRREAPAGIEVLSGDSGLIQLAGSDDTDIVVVAVVGMAGLKPALAALNAGTDIALATKETLVVAGKLVLDTAAETGSKILPVDSEHSAIFQCVHRCDISSVKRIILTASGGPFADKPHLDLERVTVSQALNHPRWEMGKKISIDSATMMNKGLELMEASWLFNVPMKNIDIVIHPESIIHSLVEFVDGSVLAQMSHSDMRFAIQYALAYPERVPCDLPSLDLAEIGQLNFSAPDLKRFPSLTLARQAAATGGTMPAVLNAANEQAVKCFLKGAIPFPDIWRIVEMVMSEHEPTQDPDLDEIISVDRWAREVALEKMKL
ncbi:MAG: 1-deoxy-D-xylulose-5-phosphate reductoisomerase [Lentisphaerae bacterium]|nr:1-deoxy-D-xylulose-5-phosphate reductoisomerase [Lentisphaerota bacterium]